MVHRVTVNYPKEPVFFSVDGQLYTKSLFLETSYEDLSQCLYTLRKQDKEHKGVLYPSFHRLYVEIGDPTEYQVAVQLFGGWAHWQRVASSPGHIGVAVQAARDELEVKLRSEGVGKLVALAKNGEERAAKWLAEKGWEPKSLGRPTRERIAKEAKKLQSIKDEVMADAERLKGIK